MAKMHDTTAREVADEKLAEAQKGIGALQVYLITLSKEIDIHREYNRGLGFHIDWGTQLMNNALAVYNDIARCNGATLVRATLTRATEPAGAMITCQPNGTRCNICRATFPDGDPVCANGHEMGKQYRTQ